jgi:alcohol dehydrogenase
VHLPENLEYATAASLGCRFVTSFRAIVDQGRVRGGEWVAVHGCGGVGLSAIMIATALGANVIAIDISDEKLSFAREIGAVATIDGSVTGDVVKAVREITKGGAHVSIDALGSPGHLLQFDQEPAPARPPCAGRPDARRACQPADPDGHR